ncbi:MAG: DUF1919 domain-containing protein [Selenomonadaceae bacterium]|nr:DUF1919 domain-containing protein [Selenomonadaceae bacterium]MBR6267612.1 DUF1919 domain-containing protein [Selenomonadaceae bacterium]
MKICMWLAGPDITLGKRALSVLRRLYGEAEVVGVTGKKPYAVDLRKEGYGGGFMDMAEAESKNPDAILMTGNPYWPFGYSARDVRTPKGDRPSCKVLLDRIVCMPGFTVEKYEQLKASRLSILSMNGFGWILHCQLDIPILTPCTNMFFEYYEQWLDFLESPREYMGEPLQFLRMQYNKAGKLIFPRYKLKNVEIGMDHYADFDLAEQEWYERIGLVNWENIFAVMYTDRRDILERFDKLPYKKKACFVSFETDLESGYYLDLGKTGLPLWDAVNRLGYGWKDMWYYDFFDMLLEGKKTPLR